MHLHCTGLTTVVLIVDVAPVVCDTAANLLLVGLTWHKTFSIKRNAYRAGVTVPLSTLLAKDGALAALLHMSLYI